LTMTLHFDKTTEAIAHFIGLFEIKLEEARLRDAYEKFKALQDAQEEPPELPFVDVDVKAPYELRDFIPNVPYRAAPPELMDTAPGLHPGLQPPEIPPAGEVGSLDRSRIPDQIGPAVQVSTGIVEAQIVPPGSTVLYTSQYIHLSDNDFVSLGDHGLGMDLKIDNSALMADLVEAAQRISPLDGAEIPGSAEEMATFITSAAEKLHAFSQDDDGQDGVFITNSDALEGIYVNGELVVDAPRFEDYRPAPDETTDDAPDTSTEASGAFAEGGGTVSVQASVELEAGGNTLINSAVVTNNWLQSHVLAVAGDHVELNAIIQVNAWYDSDLLSPSLNGWNLASENPSQAFNIAMFKHLDPTPGQGGQATAGDFPVGWVVTEIKGDLMITNWLEQFTFMTDEDIAILACSGASASIVAGGNTAINNISLAELGSYYDLIFIGGNVYDANIIQQLNILLDCDLVGAVDGFETSGEGSVSAGGNLLWNYAGIVEAGGAMGVKPMPQSYLDALGNLANGKTSAPNDILQDDVFAGMNGLRVLYISGDLINLNYIKQTNILGDADQVALAQSALEGQLEGDWTISTGSNTLVNNAAIVDVDTGTTIYAGGGAYSDEVLIQAELIKDEPYLDGQNPDALVNEAVVFLGDDMMAPDPGPQPSDPGQSDFGQSQAQTNQGADHASPAFETTNADPMHSMLA
ncbi:MAG TPA: hypothetical protein VD840_09700, partial [Sinorhizobium sp.]|nr:hypothetical protein [Sinorhizobium sp.]